MFKVLFYTDRNEKSEIVDFLDELKASEETCKTARVNRNKILVYIQALQENGTRIGSPFVKHIEGNLWELRPLKNRIFFFCWHSNTFVLLSHFVKKTQKTPEKELERARHNQRDFLERMNSK